MRLIELRDKINNIIEKTPSWANVERIGIVTESYEDGSKDMLWLFVLFVVMVKVWLHLNW